MKTPVLQPQLEHLHVKQIHTEFNSREMGDISDIMLSIQKEGQITPIMVFKKKNTYQVIAGHRRLWAMRKLGLPYIRAEVYQHVAAQKVLIQQAIENTARSPLTIFEQSILFRKLEDSGLSLKEISVRLGVGLQTVRHVDTAAKYIPKNKLADISYGKQTKGQGKVPLTVAQILAVARKYNTIKVKEFNEIWARVKKDKMSRADVRKFLDAKAKVKKREERVKKIKEYHGGQLPDWANSPDVLPPRPPRVPKEQESVWVTIKFEVKMDELKKKGFYSKEGFTKYDKDRLMIACRHTIRKHLVDIEKRY